MPSPIILDGGFSRELIALGAPFEQPEWSALVLLSENSSDHDLVRQAHSNFLQAGADIITTNSYALVPFHIGEERFWERGKELAALAGRLAREAADAENARRSGEEASGRVRRPRVRVAGSLPPMFGSYEPELFDGTRVQEYLRVLMESLAPYVDLWLGETLSLIEEGQAVVEATKRTGKEVWVSFTLDDRGNSGAESGKVVLRSGESVTAAAERVKGWDAVSAMLFNCSRPEYMLPAVKEAMGVLRAGERMIGVYANRFEPQGDEYKANEGISTLREDLGAEVYVDMARNWVDAGATIVGGCCGVGSDYIRRLADDLSDIGRAKASHS